jgi:hypothetical protein
VEILFGAVDELANYIRSQGVKGQLTCHLFRHFPSFMLTRFP